MRCYFFFSSRRRHTRCSRDWSSDVCSSDLSEGLHQAVEAKEGVAVQEESQTLATITIQNYFRMYDKLAGMTGTAETEETEFFQIYGLEGVVSPTHPPARRGDEHDLISKTARGEDHAN